MSSIPPGLVRTVCVAELRGLVRDRRAFLMAVVLPMVLFPVLFFGMDELDRATEEALSERTVRIGADLRAMDVELADRIRLGLVEEARRIELRELELDGIAEDEPGDEPEAKDGEPDEATRDLLMGRELLLVARDDFPRETTVLRLVLDGSDSLANEARRRVGEVLSEVDREWRAERLEQLLGGDPAAGLATEAQDVAEAEDAVGHALGELLPIVLVLMLVSGGSFAALGAFAGEREAGTIETLLVQPVPAMSLATGKFLAVLATACVALVGNATSFLVCVSLGLGDAARLAADIPLTSNLGRLALGLFLFLPTAVLLAAVLCLTSARARSFREGQHYVFPILLVASTLAVASTQDRVAASALLALIPITGPTLVLRDTLAGSFPPVVAALSFAASCGWAALVLGRLAETLDAERLFRDSDSASEAAQRRVQSRRALAWGAASVAIVYIVGGRLQTADPVSGLLLTLWVVVPLLAIAAARGTARRAGEPLHRVLGLGVPRPTHVVGAFLMAPGLAALVLRVFEWQGRILPVPSGFQELELVELLGEMSTPMLVFLLAVSPGWNEELLFRGAILSGLRRDLSPVRVVLWQALLFGAVHASPFRFVPTALVGAVLAALTLRSGRLWPAVALHASYNALLALEVTEHELWNEPLALGLLLLGLLAFLRKP